MIGFGFVDDRKADYTVVDLCRVAKVSRSAYYAWRSRPPSKRAVADAELGATIREIHEQSRGTYGAPRICGQLRRAGHHTSRHRVARLMRAQGLVGAHGRRKWRRGRHTANPAWNPIRDAYLDVAPGLADLAPLTPDRPDYDPEPEIRTSAYFDLIERHVFDFEVAYPIDRFLRLIDTYASHQALDPRRRSLLHERLRIAAGDQLSGTVTKPYETLLLLGTRR